MDAIRRIEEYTQGIEEEEFYRNYLVQDGVIRQLEIIGEATKKISKETRDKHTHIPWNDIAGMRDKLIHGYFDINFDVVWETVTEDLPLLIAQLEKIAPN